MYSLALIIISAVANSVMDTLKFRFGRSIFNRSQWLQFCGPQSWRNKWKDGLEGKEKFMFSSTILVFITDAWHLSQFIMLKCFVLAVILYKPLVNCWADFLIYSVSFSLTFELFFSKIWQNKK